MCAVTSCRCAVPGCTHKHVHVLVQAIAQDQVVGHGQPMWLHGVVLTKIEGGELAWKQVDTTVNAMVCPRLKTSQQGAPFEHVDCRQVPRAVQERARGT